MHFLATCRHWIFDLDGTLTAPVHDFAYIRRELDIPDGMDILEYIAALPVAQQLKTSRRLYELEQYFASQTRPATGLYELLDKLQKNHCQLGIVTRNSQLIARHTLSALSIATCFSDDDLIGRDEAPPKPSPQGILTLLDKWQAAPNQTVMVGDQGYDLQAGRNAGCYTLHVQADPEHSWPELSDMQVSSLEQVSDLLGW